MFTDISEECPASIFRDSSTLKKEAAHSSETSVNNYQTVSLHIPEDNNFHTHHHENLKSHVLTAVLIPLYEEIIKTILL
jgi:hypothetical protein